MNLQKAKEEYYNAMDKGATIFPDLKTTHGGNYIKALEESNTEMLEALIELLEIYNDLLIGEFNDNIHNYDMDAIKIIEKNTGKKINVDKDE